MRSDHRNSLWIVLAGCTMLLLAGIRAASIEISPFLGSGSSEYAKVIGLASGQIGPGLSISSQLQFLFDCRVALASITGRAQPTATRQKVIATCVGASDRLVSQSPTFSAAWYTGALAMSFVPQRAGLNIRLRKSFETGPHELWIAELRTDLVLDNFDSLDADLIESSDADLLMLLGVDAGRQSLAPRYLSRPALQVRIDAQLARITAADRSRFQNIVERLDVERGRSNGRG
ncbi:MAG: hypothetical protein ABI414_01910 [Devosia sp.]